MRPLLIIFCFQSACATRHVEGYDRFTEVCADNATLFELGNTDLDCTAVAGPGGQLRLQIILPVPLYVPYKIEAADLGLGEWCPPNSDDCIRVTSGHLVLTAYEEGIATSGHYDFLLEDGSALNGELAAQFCDAQEGC
jgi:hypothetical protein